MSNEGKDSSTTPDPQDVLPEDAPSTEAATAAAAPASERSPARSTAVEPPPADQPDGAAPVDETSPSVAGSATSDETAAAAPTRDADEPAGNEPAAAPPAKASRIRHPRALGAAFVFAFCTYLIMAQNGQFRFSVPLGLLLLLGGCVSLFHALGSFDSDVDDGAPGLAVGRLALPTLSVLGAITATGASLVLAQSGLLPGLVGGALVFVTYVGVLAALFWFTRSLGGFRDGDDDARPLHQRHGFWLLVFAGLLYLPTLGLFSLSDPWETHYGEVAREILARDDWISLWWVQDGWFWSKPILNFWIQALAMSALFTRYQPGEMLIGAGGAPVAHPEWVVRAPNVALTLIAMYVLYRGIAKVYGRRAGFLGGLVLATCPDWYFLAHQTMTDMPFVAPMTAAMGFLLLGLHTPDTDTVKSYPVRAFGRNFHVSVWHLLFTGMLLVVVPQILYLFSRNLELVLFGEGAKGFHAHFDRFMFGSAGNCGQPGNEACRAQNPALAATSVRNPLLRFVLGIEPSVQALVWTLTLGLLITMCLHERRTRRLLYLAAWLFAGVATLGKGPVGIVLPAVCMLGYIFATKRFGEIVRLEVVAGFLLLVAVALPWFVAMYVRHGGQFTDRLIFHDMWKRALEHVHDTNDGDDTSFRFYIWQLGYALFPWIGLAPLGLVAWMRRGLESEGAVAEPAHKGKADVAVFLFMWFLFAFSLFSYMGTKFHHYIFPAVPPVAMLVGILLDELIGDSAAAPRARWRNHALAASGGIIAALGAMFAFGSPFGTHPGTRTNLLVAGVCAVIGLVFVGLAHARGRKTSLPGAPGRALLLATGSLGGAFLLALVARDLWRPAFKNEGPGAIRFVQLFTYQYRRPWPDSLDFHGVLLAFGLGITVLGLLLAIAPLRRVAAVAFLGFACVIAFWGEDAYFVKVSPHWGQREVIQAYYQDRSGPEAPLVAYQMNWKGENFYTGNRIATFVATGAKFSEWLKKQREAGVSTVYLVTEHNRLNGLRSEVKAVKYTELTDKTVCNKFVMIRADL